MLHIRSANLLFLKYSQSFVHEPESITRAGRLGTGVDAPYLTAPLSEPGRLGPGWGGEGAAAPDLSCLMCTVPDPGPALVLPLH